MRWPSGVHKIILGMGKPELTWSSAIRVLWPLQGPGHVSPGEKTRSESAELEEETGAQRGSVLAQTDR